MTVILSSITKIYFYWNFFNQSSERNNEDITDKYGSFIEQGKFHINIITDWSENRVVSKYLYILNDKITSACKNIKRMHYKIGSN